MVKPGSIAQEKNPDNAAQTDARWQDVPIWKAKNHGEKTYLQISAAPILTSTDIESATPARGVGQQLQLDLELGATGRTMLKEFTEDPANAEAQLAVTLDHKVFNYSVVKGRSGSKVSIAEMSRDDLLEIIDTIRYPLACEVELLEIIDHPGRDQDTTVVSMIYPNPLAPDRYVVFNSGPTFREGHDRTNSLQNPKLPDWAIIDLTQMPDSNSPGKILSAGFFDEHWQLSSEQTFTR